MPKVKQVVARKDYPDFGIVKGQKHYNWVLKTGPRSSRTFRQVDPPRPSQLTTSEFLGTMGDIEIEIDNLVWDDGLPDVLRDIAERVREAGENARERFDNMPDGLQQGDTGQMLEERADGAESWADELEQIADALGEKIDEVVNLDWRELDAFEDFDVDEDDEPTEDEIEEARREQLSSAYEEAVGEASGSNPGFS